MTLALKAIATHITSVNAEGIPEGPEIPNTAATSGATTPAVKRPPAAVSR